MNDPFNPTRDEIQAWAYSDELWPEEEFDLYVTDSDNADLLVALAADATCPKRDFFLRCLDLLVSDAIRTGGRRHRLENVAALVEQAAANPGLQQWVTRSRRLLAEKTRG